MNRETKLAEAEMSTHLKTDQHQTLHGFKSPLVQLHPIALNCTKLRAGHPRLSGLIPPNPA